MLFRSEQIINNSGSKNEILEADEKFADIDMTKANINLAFVYPTAFSKYAKSSINTVAGYLSFKNDKSSSVSPILTPFAPLLFSNITFGYSYN